MSKKKSTELPELWTYYRVRGYHNVALLPFKPTLVEFWWTIYSNPPPPIGDRYWANIEQQIKNWGCDAVPYKERGSDACHPYGNIDDTRIATILNYARVRHQHPLLPPAVMDFSHFV